MHGLIFAIAAGMFALYKKESFMNIKLKKAFSDLWVHPGRTLLVIFALVIGLWGVGTILVSYTILKNDLNENYLMSKPAHLVLTSKDFKKKALEDLILRPEIESAEFREFSLQRIEIFPDRWIPLWLYGVDDFRNFEMAKLFPEEGSNVPSPGTILIERNGMLVSNIKNGSVPEVRIGSKTIHVPVSGIIFDPAQAPATQDMFIYAYTDRNTYQNLTGEKINQRIILRLKNVSSRKEVSAFTERLIREFEAEEIFIDTVDIPKFNEHPHQWQLNTILSLEGVIGFLAFIMGMVLVSQLMGSILAGQIRTIGIMKAVGASSFAVFKIYVLMILIPGSISGVVAAPLAVKTGYAFAGFIAGKLNFNILTLELPVYFYVVFAFMAVFLPILFSLPAILGSVKISTLEALNDYGTSNELSSSASFFKFKILSYSSQLALRNVLRRKKRSAATIAMMALGVSIFSTGFNVRAALSDFLLDSRNSMKYDVQVVLKKQVSLDEALLPFKNLENVESIESWNGGTGRLQSKVISTGGGIGITALPYNSSLIKWNVIKGRWLNNTQQVEFVMNQQAAGLYENPEIGKMYDIHLKGKSVSAKLTGIVKEFDAPKIYFDKDVYDRLANPDHLVNSLLISAKNRDYEKVISLERNVEKAGANSELSILYIMSQAERGLIIFNHLNIILSILIFLSLLVLLVSALGMASSTGINVMERTREIGVMRAIGATPAGIYNLFVMEGMVTGLISITLGVMLALPMSYYASIFFGKLILGDATRLDFAFSFPGFLITVLVTAVFGFLASRIPARRAIQVSTREALSYE